jgi:hypothetical protein
VKQFIVYECLLPFSSESLPFPSPKNLKIKIYKTIILSVPYGCETWSLTLREENRLRVSENWEMRIFGPGRIGERLKRAP